MKHASCPARALLRSEPRAAKATKRPGARGLEATPPRPRSRALLRAHDNRSPGGCPRPRVQGYFAPSARQSEQRATREAGLRHGREPQAGPLPCSDCRDGEWRAITNKESTRSTWQTSPRAAGWRRDNARARCASRALPRRRARPRAPHLRACAPSGACAVSQAVLRCCQAADAGHRPAATGAPRALPRQRASGSPLSTYTRRDRTTPQRPRDLLIRLVREANTLRCAPPE